jgi:hypothetical protein
MDDRDEQVEGRRCGFSEVIWRPDEIVEDRALPFASTVEEGLECVDCHHNRLWYASKLIPNVVQQCMCPSLGKRKKKKVSLVFSVLK